MIGFLISLLVFALIAGVVLYVAKLVISSLPVTQPFANLAYAAIVLILLVLFLSEVGWWGAPHGWRHWGRW